MLLFLMKRDITEDQCVGELVLASTRIRCTNRSKINHIQKVNPLREILGGRAVPVVAVYTINKKNERKGKQAQLGKAAYHSKLPCALALRPGAITPSVAGCDVAAHRASAQGITRHPIIDLTF